MVQNLNESLGFVRVREPSQPEFAAIEYRATPAMCHSGSIVQGGFVTGWIDAAMAHAVMAATLYRQSPLSLEIKISFLKSAAPGLVVAEGWVEKMGRSTAFLEGRLLDADGEVLAKGSSTVKLVPAERMANG